MTFYALCAVVSICITACVCFIVHNEAKEAASGACRCDDDDEEETLDEIDADKWREVIEYLKHNDHDAITTVRRWHKIKYNEDLY